MSLLLFCCCWLGNVIQTLCMDHCEKERVGGWPIVICLWPMPAPTKYQPWSVKNCMIFVIGKVQWVHPIVSVARLLHLIRTSSLINIYKTPIHQPVVYVLGIVSPSHKLWRWDNVDFNPGSGKQQSFLLHYNEWILVYFMMCNK